MIIRTRRKLLDCVRAFQKGASAPGVDEPERYRMRSGGVIVPAGVNGLDAMADLLHDRVPLEEFRTQLGSVGALGAERLAPAMSSGRRVCEWPSVATQRS